MDYHVSTGWLWIILVLAVWDIVWRGLALWRAGRNRQLGWFVVLLVINSVGILPIIYLLLNRTPGQTLSSESPARRS